MYAFDNPARWWDPTGHATVPVGGDAPNDDELAREREASAYAEQLQRQAPRPWDNAATPQPDARPTVVQEEGWLAKAKRKVQEGWDYLSQQVGDGWDAMARSMFHPGGQRYQPGLFPKPEEQAGREISQRNIGQTAQNTAGEIARRGGEGWVEGTRFLIEMELGNRAGEAVVGGAGRTKQLLAGEGGAAAAEARSAKTAQQAIATDARAGKALSREAEATATKSGESVYGHLDDAGKENYIGISDDLPRRAGQHRLDPGKTGSTMVRRTDPLTHDQARTIEAMRIRARLDQARKDGLITGREPIAEQLRKAGLLNKNRGRDPGRWVKDLDPDEFVRNFDESHSFDIRTPVKK